MLARMAHGLPSKIAADAVQLGVWRPGGAAASPPGRPPHGRVPARRAGYGPGYGPGYGSVEELASSAAP